MIWETVINAILHASVYLILVPLFGFLLKQQMKQYNEVARKLTKVSDALSVLAEIKFLTDELKTKVNTINTHIDYMKKFDEDIQNNYTEVKAELKVLNDKLIETMSLLSYLMDQLDK